MTEEERSSVLQLYVSDATRQGWRVISQAPTQVQLVKGKPTNHLLHFFLGFVTFGVWWITVWPAVALFAGEKQRFVTVDPSGRVLV